MKKRLPAICPSCQNPLRLTELGCPRCGTKIQGDFSLPLFLQLDQEEQAFIMDFIKFSGSLKLMAKKLNLSYPTVRNRLDDLITKIKMIEQKQAINEKDL